MTTTPELGTNLSKETIKNAHISRIPLEISTKLIPKTNVKKCLEKISQTKSSKNSLVDHQKQQPRKHLDYKKLRLPHKVAVSLIIGFDPNQPETLHLEKHYYIHGLTTGYKSLSYQLNQDFSLVEAWVLLKPKHNSRVCHHAYLSCISSFAIPTSLINFTWLSLKACSFCTMGSNQF